MQSITAVYWKLTSIQGGRPRGYPLNLWISLHLYILLQFPYNWWVFYIITFGIICVLNAFRFIILGGKVTLNKLVILEFLIGCLNSAVRGPCMTFDSHRRQPFNSILSLFLMWKSQALFHISWKYRAQLCLPDLQHIV
jgi:hypothetical protein